MTKTTTLSVAVIAITLTLFTNSSWADLVVIDQVSDAYNAPSPSGELGGPTIADFQSALQTFTVGIGGTLTGIDLQVQQSGAPSVPTDNLVVSILGTSGGMPDFNQNLGSVSLPAASISPFDNFASGDFVPFDVSGLGISVSPGDVLAIAASYPTGTGSYFVYDSEVDVYAGGTSYIYGPLDGFLGSTAPRDLGFRTIVTVPEPFTFYAGLVVMVVGPSRTKQELIK